MSQPLRAPFGPPAGKYLNGYRELPPSYIPDGYNRWFAMRSQGEALACPALPCH